MIWFTDLKISKKLISSFILIALISGAMGAYGITNLKSLENSDTELYETMTVPISELGELGTNFQTLRVDIRDMLSTQSSEEVATKAKEIEEIRSNVTKLGNSIEKTLVTSEVKKQYDIFVEARKAYGPELDKVIELAKANKKDEAIAKNNQNTQLGQAEENAIKNLISATTNAAKDKSDLNSKTAHTTINIMLVVIVFVMIISILIGLYISGLITKPLKKVLYIIEEMSKGHLSERANINTNDEVGQMSKAMDSFADNLQTNVVGAMNKIAAGDVSMNITIKDEKDEITPALNAVVETLNRINNGLGKLTKETSEGNLDSRGREHLYSGAWKEIVVGINGLIEATVKPVREVTSVMSEISKGNVGVKVTGNYQGEFKVLESSVNDVIEVINTINKGLDNVTKETSEGNLNARGREHIYSGAWKEIVAGINRLIEAVVKPIQEVTSVMGEIAKGNVEVKVTGNYQGQFNVLGNSVNDVIEVINTINKGLNNLTNETSEGNLEARGREHIYSGAWKEIVAGINRVIEAVVKPIQEVTSVMSEMSKGNLDISVSEGYKGEFGVLANAVNSTEESLKSIVGEISEIIGEISKGNLEIENIKEFDGDFKSISVSLNTIIDSLNSVLSEIDTASEQVFTGSSQVSDGSQALSQGATEQASAIEQLTSSITEVAAQTKENAVNANQAKDLALKVKENAEEGNKHMSEMLKSMGEINESSANISKIIKVIDEIAFQTNILALNAAVEAARAGQHGKGFAVVAEEVRNLAARSANAAKETTDLIEGSIKKAEKGTDIANNTAKALYEIVDGVSKAATLVAEIAASSNEQATGISQINLGIEQVSQVVQTNSATAEESAAASEELSSQAQLLKERVSNFKLKNSNSISLVNNITKNKQYYSRENNVAFKEVAVTSNKPKIALSDKEFGKY